MHRKNTVRIPVVHIAAVLFLAVATALLVIMAFATADQANATPAATVAAVSQNPSHWACEDYWTWVNDQTAANFHIFTVDQAKAVRWLRLDMRALAVAEHRHQAQQIKLANMNVAFDCSATGI